MDAVQFMAQNGKDFWSTHPSGAGNNQYRSGPQAFPSKVRTSEHGSVKTGNIMAGPSEYESYPETDNTTAKQTESAEVLCGRCKTSLSPDTAEYCFYCCGWLCGECWEYFGECGHIELKSKARVGVSFVQPGANLKANNWRKS